MHAAAVAVAAATAAGPDASIAAPATATAAAAAAAAAACMIGSADDQCAPTLIAYPAALEGLSVKSSTAQMLTLLAYDTGTPCCTACFISSDLLSLANASIMLCSSIFLLLPARTAASNTAEVGTVIADGTCKTTTHTQQRHQEYKMGQRYSARTMRYEI